MRLRERAALVTGAGSGIGRAVALRLAEEGARVAVNDVRADAAKQAAEEIAGQVGAEAAFPAPADVSDPAAVARMFGEVDARLGGLDVLVNNAGIEDGVRDTLGLSDEAFDRMLRVHLYGTFYCTRAAVERMAPGGGGAIVNVSSVAALMGGGMVHYSAAKAGVLGLTRAVAADVGPKGIRVNAICPGYIETPMTLGAHGPEHRDRIARTIPLRRAGQPDDIAATVVFLASDESAYMTGQWLSPNGGMLMI